MEEDSDSEKEASLLSSLCQRFETIFEKYEEETTVVLLPGNFLYTPKWIQAFLISDEDDVPVLGKRERSSRWRHSFQTWSFL